MKTPVAIREVKDLGNGKWKAIADTGDSFFFEPNGIVIKQEDVPIAEAVVFEWELETRSNGKEFKVVKAIVKEEKKTGMLPKTSVESTEAPGGTPPVAAASKSKKTDYENVDWSKYQKPWLPEESHRAAVGNIIQAVLQSGMLQELTMNKSRKEAYEEFDSLVEHSLQLYEKNK